MKIWNVGEKDIKHLYNNRMFVIKANVVMEVSDDLGLFLLNNKTVRGFGLVQLKDGDKKGDCYIRGREQIYKWAVEKYADYEKHCEEREAQRLQPVKPHLAILEYKKTIDDYEKWLAEGQPIKKEYEGIIGERKIFICPHCELEFQDKETYFGHITTHQKEENAVNIGAVKDTSKGKS